MPTELPLIRAPHSSVWHFYSEHHPYKTWCGIHLADELEEIDRYVRGRFRTTLEEVEADTRAGLSLCERCMLRDDRDGFPYYDQD
jgi:hypothetical protein